MSKEIMEVDAQEISPLEQNIETTLVKANITDKVIEAMKKKFGHLKLKDIDDKEGYLIVKDARKEVRKIGVLTEKLCKQGREDAIAVQKKWLSKEKEVLGKIAEVQDPLDAEIKKYEDEVARKQKEEEEKQEREYMVRQTILLKMEAKYENDCFVLGNVSYQLNNIKEADAEIWEETILPKYQREFEKIETVRAEEEKRKTEEAEKLKAAQEKFEQEQLEFKQKQEAFEKQQQALQQQQEEANKVERERKEAKNKVRMQELLALGLHYSAQYKSFVFSDVNVAETEIVTLEDVQWNELIDKITPVIKEREIALEKEAEEKREKELEQARLDAIAKEQLRAAEEQKQKDLKEQQEEQQRLEEQAKASDKEKWAALVQQFVTLNLPEFKSNIYKGKLTQLKQKVKEIQAL